MRFTNYEDTSVPAMNKDNGMGAFPVDTSAMKRCVQKPPGDAGTKAVRVAERRLRNPHDSTMDFQSTRTKFRMSKPKQEPADYCKEPRPESTSALRSCVRAHATFARDRQEGPDGTWSAMKARQRHVPKTTACCKKQLPTRTARQRKPQRSNRSAFGTVRLIGQTCGLPFLWRLSFISGPKHCNTSLGRLGYRTRSSPLIKRYCKPPPCNNTEPVIMQLDDIRALSAMQKGKIVDLNQADDLTPIPAANHREHESRGESVLPWMCLRSCPQLYSPDASVVPQFEIVVDIPDAMSRHVPREILTRSTDSKMRVSSHRPPARGLYESDDSNIPTPGMHGGSRDGATA